MLLGQRYSKAHIDNRLQTPPSVAMCVISGDTVFTVSISDKYDSKAVHLRSFERDGTLIDSVTLSYVLDTNLFGVFSCEGGLKELTANKLILSIDYITHDHKAGANYFILDHRLNVLDSTVFKADTLAINKTTEIIPLDSTFVVIGQYYRSYQMIRMFIAEFDHNLNLLWQNNVSDFRNYPYTNYYGYFPNNAIKHEGAFYITGYCRYPNMFVESFLLKIDSVGNKIYDKRYRYKNWSTSSGGIILLGKDSLFIPSGHAEIPNAADDDLGKFSFRIMDTSGVLLNDTVYPELEWSTAINFALKLSDGNILVSAWYYYGGEKAVLWKLDQNMNTIWRRVYYYSQWEDSSRLMGLSEWSDGGIIGVGQYFNRYQSGHLLSHQRVALWIISVDSTGCLSASDCGSGIGMVEWPVTQESSVVLYPNPSQGSFKIELPDFTHNTCIRIFETNGKEIYQTQVQSTQNIEINDFTAPPGSYFVEILADNVLYTRTLLIL